MKLPGSNERFIVANQSSVFYGHVVSGIHLEVRGDDDVSHKELFFPGCPVPDAGRTGV